MIQKDDIKHKDYSHFLRLFSQIKISGIMKKLGFYKEKGIQPVSMMLQFLMSLMTTTSILKFMARGGTSNNDERYSMSVYCTGFSETLHTTGGLADEHCYYFEQKDFCSDQKQA